MRRWRKSEEYKKEYLKREAIHKDRGNKDEKLYATVWRELEEGTFDNGLWARLLAEYDGNEEKTKADYLRIRVERLKKTARKKRTANKKSQHVRNLEEYKEWVETCKKR